MVSRVAPPHESCSRAETPLRRRRTTKTAPAAPLRHERHLKRAHGEDTARGRATGRALRGERGDKLQARVDELRMAARGHRADVRDEHLPRGRRGGRRAQAHAIAVCAPPPQRCQR